jgi:hypothetical protein
MYLQRWAASGEWPHTGHKRAGVGDVHLPPPRHYPAPEGCWTCGTCRRSRQPAPEPGGSATYHFGCFVTIRVVRRRQGAICCQWFIRHGGNQIYIFLYFIFACNILLIICILMFCFIWVFTCLGIFCFDETNSWNLTRTCVLLKLHVGILFKCIFVCRGTLALVHQLFIDIFLVSFYTGW